MHLLFEKKMSWKSLCLLILKSITEIIKKFKSLYDFEGCCLKLKDICIDFDPYFKVHNLVSVHPKSIILGQMTNLNMNMIFYVVVSVYRLVKIWKSKLDPVPWWISEWPMQAIFLGPQMGGHSSGVPDRACRNWGRELLQLGNHVLAPPG